MVSDTNDQFLYGVETIKRANGLDVEYNFLASDGKGGYRILKQWNFAGTHRDDQSPFNAERGWSDLLRRDDMVQVFWWGSYPRFYIPEIRGRKSAKIHVALGTFGDKPLVTHMYLDGIEYRKDMVSGNRAVPNRFSAGSTVVINSENDSVQINGIDSVVDVVDGSNWLSIPPGKSTIELYLSSFAGEKPSVKVEFEERWL